LIKLNRSLRNVMMASALVLASVAAQAATVAIKATLSAAQEVPKKDSEGKGTLTGILDPSNKELTYHVTYEGLTGPATAAHFHGPADPGANAGPQVPVAMKPLNSPIDGKATLTDDQVKDLMAGKWYFNIHTAANPGGEIRGQVMVGK
jgi:CHRD domain